MDAHSLTASLSDYLLKWQRSSVEQLMKTSTEAKKTCRPSFYVNLNELQLDFAHFVNDLIERPELDVAGPTWCQSPLSIVKEAIILSQQSILDESGGDEKVGSVETGFIVRLRHEPQLVRTATTVPGSSLLNKLVSFRGTVVRMTTERLVDVGVPFRCQRCKQEFLLEVDLCRVKLRSAWEPAFCRADRFCRSKAFAEEEESGRLQTWYQELKVQEEQNSLNHIPQSVFLIVSDELVNFCKVGDMVQVTGVAKLYIGGRPVAGRAPNLQVCIFVHTGQLCSLAELSSEPDDGFGAPTQPAPSLGDRLRRRDLILKSICPQLFGMFQIKLSVGLVLAGGVNGDRSASAADSSHWNGLVSSSSVQSNERGNCHLLLIGDPGTGKSQYLKFIDRVVEKSVYSTGVGSSGAGLTATAVHDGDHWILEPGALVLADGGVCCIDEFNTIASDDRGVINEAMEQQRISMAKSGNVRVLSTRCSVVAAANTKGPYDVSQSLTINTAIPTPLLSRFDLIFVLIDSFDADWNKSVGRTIVSKARCGQSFKTDDEPLLTEEQLRKKFVKLGQIEPKLSNSARLILERYYREQRLRSIDVELDESEKLQSRTTVRLLQSLRRLSQAHARLMGHHQVAEVDAVMAVHLMETSFQSTVGLCRPGQSMFADDPLNQYYEIRCKVLQMLKMDPS